MFTRRKFIRYLFLCPVILAFLPVLLSHQHVDPDAKVILENLYSAGSVSGYLKNLLSLATVDFQPLRDLSLSLDIWAFYRMGMNTFVAQNLLWWLASLYLFACILRAIFRDLSELGILLIVSCVGVYPLYSNVISWGMNRKHLMALFFITYATKLLIKSSRKSLIVICYLLSTLSQPIHLLWLAWAAVFLYQKNEWRTNSRLLLSLTFVFIFVAALNTFYYSHSETYKLFYTDKTADLWNFPDKILALGHYSFQLMAPYFLSFKYDLSHWSVLIGVVLLPLFLYLCYKRTNHRELLLWSLAGLLPILMVLNDPHVISDAYLLFPGFALTIIIVHLLRSFHRELSPNWLVIPLLLWGTLSAKNSKLWNSREELAQASFETRPSCESAMNSLKVSYDHYVRSEDALSFAETNDCFKDFTMTNSFYVSMVVIFAHYYFHEEKLPLDFRLERLRTMREKHLYARLSLAGLLIKNEKLEEARTVVEEFPAIDIAPEYHEITARYVHPFCVRENLGGCLLITEKLIRKPDRPNL